MMGERRRKILITGGRAPAALDLTRKLSSLGHEIHVAESLPRYISRRSDRVARSYLVPAPARAPVEFVETLKAILIAEKIDVLIPTCEEAFYVSRGRSLLIPHADILVDGIDTLGMLHHKGRFISRILELGLPVPDTRVFQAPQRLDEALRELPPETRMVLKPAYSRFAAKTRIAPARDLLLAVSGLGVSPRNPWLLQEHLMGKEYCTYAICRDGEVRAQVIYDHEFTAGRGAGISFLAVRNELIEAWVRKVVSELRLTGQIAFDLMLTSSGEVLPIECNPRATSGIHLLSATQLESALLGRAPLSEPLSPPAGKLAKVGLAMWVYGLPSVGLSPRRLASWWKVVSRGEEVIYDATDPKPYWDQFGALGDFWMKSRRSGGSILEASTADIEWNGEEPS